MYVMGDNGIFKKAQDAKDKTERAKEEEKSYLENLGNDIDNYLNGNGGGSGITEPPADFATEPDKYKHPDQSDTNGDRAVGTDGKPVNMDLWTYVIIDEEKKYVDLQGATSGTAVNKSAYLGSFSENGEIQGTVPQYIKIDGKDGIYTVTAMSGTFTFCYGLIVGPEIPKTVTCMYHTFGICSYMTQAQPIGEQVTDIRNILHYCYAMNEITILSPNITDADMAFYGCMGKDGQFTVRVPSGSTTYATLNALYGTSKYITIEEF